MNGDKTIEQLLAATVLNLTDDGVVVQSGVTKKTAIQLYVDLLSGLLILGSTVTFGTTVPTGGKDGDVYIKTNSNQFYQRSSGLWNVVFTLPNPGSGTSFRYGTGAPSNTLGIDNDSYLDTLTGNIYQRETGAYGQVYSIGTGPAGARGNSILNGTVDPLTSDGVNGDFFLNTTTYKIFGPKTTGLWGTGTELLVTPNTILNGNGSPSNGLGNDGDFYINNANFTFFGPKAAGVWPTGVALSFNTSSTRVAYSKGTALPIVLANFQTAYSAYGANPKFKVRTIQGGILGITTLTNTTTASNGTYTAQAIIPVAGQGTGAAATFVVSGGIVTSVTPTTPGTSFEAGDTFTCAAVPGALFEVTNLVNIVYSDITAQATITITEIIPLTPDSVSISVDDDGTGHLADNIQLIISL